MFWGAPIPKYLNVRGKDNLRAWTSSELASFPIHGHLLPESNYCFIAYNIKDSVIYSSKIIGVEIEAGLAARLNKRTVLDMLLKHNISAANIHHPKEVLLNMLNGYQCTICPQYLAIFQAVEGPKCSKTRVQEHRNRKATSTLREPVNLSP